MTQYLGYASVPAAAYLDGYAANVMGSPYDAVGDGATDDTAAIQAALTATNVAYIPVGATFRVDGTIVLTDGQTLVLGGTLRRNSAYSAATVPLVQLYGNHTSVIGLGQSSLLQCDNHAPDGILLYGTPSPSAPSPALTARWQTVTGFQILGDGDTTTKGVACQSTQGYSSGALYDGRFSNLLLKGVGVGIYCGSSANGNSFSNINVYGITQYVIQLDGASAGVGHTVSDSDFTDIFVDGSSSCTAVLYARSANHCTAWLNAEPGGSGKFVDMDSTCGNWLVGGADNTSGGSSFAATSSIFLRNGKATIGGLLLTAASATSGAGVRIPTGTAPTSPVSGDLWYDGTNLKFRDGSTTRTISWT